MTDTPNNIDSKTDEEQAEREYEKSGLYPETGKAFHLWGLLGVLAGVIVFIALSAVVLDRILIS
ncbi:MAG: hypothetical protein R3332_09425 [Pseudohongiellaceae bacterium]|nr:hypothetical protein [Pseudohongiellaceae bacterium]